jgi:F-type H+-transporting ATPase subunit epsilon
MEAGRIHLEVVTPEEAVLAMDVDEVVLPGEEGQIGVLPGHMPLLTSLGIGEMIVKNQGDEANYFLVRGFAEVLSDRVRILAEECEGVDNIDIQKARAEFKDAEREMKRLRQQEEPEQELLEKYRESLRKARMRLMLSGELDDDE